MILDDILAHKRAEVAAHRRTTPVAALRERRLWAAPRRDFRAALARRPAPAVIAELKRASPSRGIIRADYDPPAIARGYAAAGAAALSVLTDEKFFRGALEHLTAAREASGIPCLQGTSRRPLPDRRGARRARDAVLLVVAAVAGAGGRELLAAAAEAGLDVLVEVHDAVELEWAAAAGATLIGVNNRDLGRSPSPRDDRAAGTAECRPGRSSSPRAASARPRTSAA
jgi:indole-3-glycerol phosphate synthase